MKSLSEFLVQCFAVRRSVQLDKQFGGNISKIRGNAWAVSFIVLRKDKEWKKDRI